MKDDDAFKKGDRVRWLVEQFPCGYRLYHEGEIECYWVTEGSQRLWWVQPDLRNNPQSMYEGELELITH